MPRVTVRAAQALLLLGASGVLASDWKGKAFPNWSENAVLELLTDSPWAKPRTVHFTWTRRGEQPLTYKDVPGADHGPQRPIGSPVGGIGAPKPKMPDRADIIVRWASALPVRHAKALYRQRERNLDDSKLNALIGAPDPDYVLEIFGIPALVAHQGTDTVAAVVKDSVHLRTRAGKDLRPSRVEVLLDGINLDIRIHFSRQDPIQLVDKEIEVTGDIQVFEVRERFKVSSMMYQGHLEI
ncbi:MAG: hypothetical protein IANPNBLG_00813 [Bryobacteraceae bacterium]|nr:hypothetical protein [Bryobacteraceae bacterium]